MQKRLLILLSMLLATTILVMCFAMYLKFEFFEPVGLFQDKNLIEIPFASMKPSASGCIILHSTIKRGKIWTFIII